MTPMQYELHEARKGRLERMGGGTRSNTVPLDRIRHREPKTEQRALAPFNDAERKIRKIQHAVATRYRVNLDSMRSDSKSQLFILPRQIAYTMARRLTGESLVTISRCFGRDHTTILHGTRRIEERASRDAEFATELEELEKVLIDGGSLPCPCCGSVSREPKHD